MVTSGYLIYFFFFPGMADLKLLIYNLKLIFKSKDNWKYWSGTV